MAVLNRQMFRRPSALPPLRGPMPVVRETYPVVKRDSGSSQEGEKRATTFFEKLFDAGTGLGPGVGPYADSEQGNILDLREYGAGVYDITDPQFIEFIQGRYMQEGDSFQDGIANYVEVLKEDIPQRAEGSGPHGEDKMRETLRQAIQNYLSQQQNPNLEPFSVVREGEQVYDPNSVVREGERTSLIQGSMMEKISSLYQQIKQIDPEATVREGEFVTDANANIPPDLAAMYNNMLQGDIPDSVVREGEFETISSPNSVVREGEQAYDPNYGLTDEEIELINLQITRSGHAENMLEDVLREGKFRNVNKDELRFRQAGSPPMGEQVNAENVGIMDGFSEGQAAMMMEEGEVARQQIDNSETYDELMQSTRGDNLSEADRRKELASYVGEEDAERTPDSVLALLQPVMQMLNTETANVGIAQVEDGSLEMPVEPVGIAQGGIVGYAMGGAVRKIPKYATGTSSAGVSVEEEQGFGFESEAADPYPNTANFIMDLFTQDTDTVSPIRTKYDANYKLFSDILGGDTGADKDIMIGDILSTVVAPLAMAYAQGEPLANVLGQGSKMVGEKALAYDKIKKEKEAAIKNLALTQALKKEDDPLMKVYLKDDKDTPDVDESLIAVYRKTSDVEKNRDLYTAESIAKATADLGKVKGETAKLNIETAIKEIEFEYKDILLGLEAEDKAALVDGRLITNTINQAIADNKPDLLAAELKNIDLDNIAKGITNDTLRPKLEAELDQALIDLDISTQTLKQEIIETDYAAQLANLDAEERQARINEYMQTEDFNKNMNVLLLEEKSAEINNIILTGKNLTLENEYQELENQFKGKTMNADIQAKFLENTQKRLENAKLSIENEYLPEEKKLGIDKIKLDMEKLNETIQGQVLENQTKILDLNNYNEKTFLEFEKQRLEIRKLEYDLDNPKKDWDEIKIQTEFMNKWNNSPITTMMREKQGFMQNLVTNAQENTGAGDLSFIFQYMKMLDPRSVVREGEFETAKRTGGIPASVWAAYEGIKSGKLLSPAVKADFLSAAGKMYMQEYDNYNKERATYLNIAAQNGLKAELAVPSIAFDVDLIEQLNNVDTMEKYIENFELEQSILPIEQGTDLSLGKLKIPGLD